MLHSTLAWFLNWALRDPSLNTSQLNVYLCLLDMGEQYSSSEPYCRPSVAEIARRSGLHRRTVQHATKVLHEKGIIRIVAQRAQMRIHGAPIPNIYYFMFTPPGYQARQRG